MWEGCMSMLLGSLIDKMIKVSTGDIKRGMAGIASHSSHICLKCTLCSREAFCCEAFASSSRISRPFQSGGNQIGVSVSKRENCTLSLKDGVVAWKGVHI